MAPPARAHARRKGVTLLIETTNPQFADIDIFHTLRDTVAGAESAQLGVCLDIHASWTESALQQSITRAAPITQLVQISDYVPGTRDLDRAVPGDGEIPLARILGWIEQAGYDGPLDIELRDTSGRGDQDQALLRAIERTGELLDDLAA
jgi:sugar phosphate isomerase/epimerase